MPKKFDDIAVYDKYATGMRTIFFFGKFVFVIVSHMILVV